MKFLVIILIFFNFLVFNNENIIQWSENYKLRFCDFTQVAPLNSDSLGMSRTGVKYSIDLLDDTLVFESTAFFDKNKSWIKQRDSSTLNHEQMHFNLTEVYSRKLKERVQFSIKTNLKPEAIEAQIDSIFKLNQLELWKEQDLYDNIVKIAFNEEGQVFWNHKIDSSLTVSRAFAGKK